MVCEVPVIAGAGAVVSDRLGPPTNSIVNGSATGAGPGTAATAKVKGPLSEGVLTPTADVPSGWRSVETTLSPGFPVPYKLTVPTASCSALKRGSCGFVCVMLGAPVPRAVHDTRPTANATTTRLESVGFIV